VGIENDKHHNQETIKIVNTTLFKKYPTLFFPGKTSDGKLANVITVGGGGNLHVHA
jgi:hypothetical protein